MMIDQGIAAGLQEALPHAQIKLLKEFGPHNQGLILVDLAPHTYSVMEVGGLLSVLELEEGMFGRTKPGRNAGFEKVYELADPQCFVQLVEDIMRR